MRRVLKDNPISLAAVREEHESPNVLWDLMSEVQPHEAISHKAMPTWDEHLAFVSKPPYRVWYLIRAEDEWVGMIYLTHRNEIGVRIFRAHHRKGYATWAIKEVMRLWSGSVRAKPSEARNGFVANINPQNEASMALFRKLGFVHVQNTLALDTSTPESEPEKR